MTERYVSYPEGKEMKCLTPKCQNWIAVSPNTEMVICNECAERQAKRMAKDLEAC